LAFENFDALGQFRRAEHGTTIDPSGEFDGVAFENSADLVTLIREHPNLGPCLVEQLHTYAAGHEASKGETPAIDWLVMDFEDQGFRVKPLLKAMVLNASFRKTSPVATEVAE
jgi:hypothetical protein